MPPDRMTIPPTALANGSIMFALGPSPTFWLPGQCSRMTFEGLPNSLTIRRGGL